MKIKTFLNAHCIYVTSIMMEMGLMSVEYSFHIEHVLKFRHLIHLKYVTSISGSFFFLFIISWKASRVWNQISEKEIVENNNNNNNYIIIIIIIIITLGRDDFCFSFHVGKKYNLVTLQMWRKHLRRYLSMTHRQTYFRHCSDPIPCAYIRMRSGVSVCSADWKDE
jgi:hypothetical protein